MSNIGSSSISIFKNPYLQGDAGLCLFSGENVKYMPVFFPKPIKQIDKYEKFQPLHHK